MTAPEKFRVPGRRTDTTGWTWPQNSPKSEIEVALKDHLREGYGIAEVHLTDERMEMFLLLLQAAPAPSTTQYITVPNLKAALDSLHRNLPTEQQATFYQDTQGTGKFPGGYDQPDAGNGGNGADDTPVGEREPTDLWKSTPFQKYGTREWNTYDEALDFILNENEIPFAPDASRSERLAILRNALGPIDIVPGEFGGFSVAEGEADAEVGTAGGVITTDQGMYQQGADGEWAPLDMSSSPASMEYMGGMLWMRGTDGSLAPVNNLLERMVEQKILEGDWETALQWDDFRNRPSPQEHLQSMLEYARTPADQVLLSAIARGYAEGLVPPQAGSLARVGPIPKEATEAWERYERSITGGPAREEMEEFLASEQAGREEDKAEYFQSMTDMRDAFSGAIQDIEKKNKETMDNFVKQVFDGFKEFGTQITDLTGSINSMEVGIGGADGSGAGGSDITGTGDSNITGTGGSNIGGNVNLGTPEGQLAALMQEWSNAYQGMHPPQGDMSDTEFLAWLQDKNNWPLTAAEQKAADEDAAREEVLKGEPELQDYLDEYAMASEQIGDMDEEDFSGAHVFGVAPDLVDWGSDATIAGTDTSVPESQYVYAKADDSWSGANLYTGEAADDSWQATYFEPLAEKEQAAAAQGYSSSLSDYAYEEFAGGGVVQGPTLALLGEKESEVVVPFSKIEAFRRGELPVKNQKITETGSRVAKFAEGGLVFGPGEIESRGGQSNVGAVPGRTDVNDPRYITNETLEGIRSGTLLQNPDDPYDIYSAGGRETDTTKRLDAAQTEIESRPRTFEQSLANVTGGEQGNLPIGVQQILGGRSPRPLGGRLLRQAGMALPSAQAWRNLSSDERSVYTDLARRSGISEGYLESELQTATPSGGGGARRARMLPLATRRMFR